MIYRTLTVSTVLFSLLSALPSHAARPLKRESGRVGNGGFAYVCRDADGKINTARLLDLWEAEGVPTWEKSDSVDSQLQAALARLKSYSPNAWNRIVGNLEDFRQSATYSDRTLTKTEDAFPPYQPAPGCGYEQVARYESIISETGAAGLRISKEIFNSPHFSNSDRAALFFHEAGYALDREVNEATNSQRTRVIVAHLFSDSIIPNSVRLATSATFLASNHWREIDGKLGKVSANIIAVSDPTQISFETRFSSIDGISVDNLNEMTSVQKSSFYRCSIDAYESFGKPKKKTTNWVKLKDLVGTYVYEENPKAVRIEGAFTAYEFQEPSPVGDDVLMFNTQVIDCETKSANGKIRAVPFKDAVFKLPKSENLVFMPDGSMITRKDAWYQPVSSQAKSELGNHKGLFMADYVRAAPSGSN